MQTFPMCPCLLNWKVPLTIYLFTSSLQTLKQVSMLLSSLSSSKLLLLLHAMTSISSSTQSGLSTCQPDILPRMPIMIKTLCFSLFKTIQNFDEEIQSLQPRQCKSTRQGFVLCRARFFHLEIQKLPSSAQAELCCIFVSAIYPPQSPPSPGKVLKLERKLPKTIPNQTASMEDNLNGR